MKNKRRIENMTKIYIPEEKPPLKAYLRADPHSQHFTYVGKNEDLVTYDMFWGNLSSDGLYLDYSLIKNRNIQVSEGISENDTIQTLSNEHCDEWIGRNIINSSLSKLFVIQGYAGCGKTTFLNHLIRTSNSYMSNIYIDIGRDWSYPQEPHMFFNEALGAFDYLLDELAKSKRIRDSVWKKFIEIGSDLDIKEFDLEIPNVIPVFRKIKKNSSWNSLRSNLHNYLNDTYGGKKYIGNTTDEIDNSVWHNFGQTQTVVALLVLLACAKCYTANYQSGGSFTLIFDNLDVITNPAIPAENVVLLWGVISHYASYVNKNSKKLPDFKIIITVRKVLYSHIVSHLPDLEMIASYDPFYVNVCDISNLYLSQEILNHRIKYWIDHIDDKTTIEKLLELKEIATVNDNNILLEESKSEEDYELKRTINLDAFCNHNYRAFSNVLSVFLDDDKYTKLILPDFKSESLSMDWQKVATLTFLLSFLYRKEKIWNSMGFGCKDFNTLDYPTTLNRLILNYLFVSKQGQFLYHLASERADIPTHNKVSLKQMLDMFANVKFMTINTGLNQEEIDIKYRDINMSNTEELIIDRLADMCARNPRSIHSKAYGYDSDEDELWRRPLYFVGGVKLNYTAASYDELKKYFKKKIDDEKSDEVMFAITDEGFILIRDIVANFEFYSGRYCNSSLMKPLHQATSKSELDILIQPVYNAVKTCCIRKVFFMNQYMKEYNLDKNQYFKRYFHPRTTPHYKNVSGANKKLSKYSFRPQLHIVRVIYAHIAYFNTVKELFSNYSEKKTMCECLTDWIEEYLKLYKYYFYSEFVNTICNRDNTVYHELSNLLQEQKNHYGPDGDYKNIEINIRNSRKESSY